MRSLFASFGAAIVALVLPAPAAASLVYPDYLVTKLQMPCAPGCQLCHIDASGGPFRINMKFGAAAKLAGATGAAQTATLDMALATLAASDVDGDGVSDVDELQAGTDPNAANADLCGGIKYGCGASTIARTPAEKSMEPGAAAAAATVLFGMLLMRRGRR